MSSSPTHIVILGAGFAGTSLVQTLARLKKTSDNIRSTLVDQSNYSLFTPLLHEVATGAMNPLNIVEPIRKSVGKDIDEFILARVDSVDREKKLVYTSEGEISYDYLVLSMGAKTGFFGVPGADEHTFTLKSLDDATRLKHHVVRCVEKAIRIDDLGERAKLLHFVIVGAGATGVELATELAELLYDDMQKLCGSESKDIFEQIEIHLIQSAPVVLPQFPEYFQRVATKVLQKKQVKLRCNLRVVSVDEDGVMLSNDERIEAKTVMWVAGVRGKTIPLGLSPEDETACWELQPSLQSKEDNTLFILGDMARCIDSRTEKRVPALAQVAVAQGKTAARNIIALVRGEQPVPFVYKSKGLLLSLGQWMAIAQLGPIHFSGKFAWWLWRTVYASKLLSWSKRWKVIVDWTAHIFSGREVAMYGKEKSLFVD